LGCLILYAHSASAELGQVPDIYRYGQLDGMLTQAASLGRNSMIFKTAKIVVPRGLAAVYAQSHWGLLVVGIDDRCSGSRPLRQYFLEQPGRMAGGCGLIERVC
jgi:hypothetical protein